MNFYSRQIFFVVALLLTFCCSFSVLKAEIPQACGDIKTPFSGKISITKSESGLLANARENPKEAEKILTEATSKDWAGPAIFFTLGNLYYSKGDFKSAIAQYETAVEKAPTFFAARKNLGFALVQSGQYESAEAVLRIALALSGGSDSNILLWLCDRRIAQGNYSAALVFCDQSLLYSPKNYAAMRVKAWLLLQSQRYADSIIASDAVLEENPTDAIVWKMRTFALLKIGDMSKAEASILAQRKLDIFDDFSELALARFYFQEQDFDNCANLCSEILRRTNDRRAKRDAAIIGAQALCSANRAAEAVEMCAEMCGDVEVLKIRATAAIQSGNLNLAESAYREILKINPSEARAKYELGRILLKKADGKGRGEAEILLSSASKDESLFIYANLELLKIYLDNADNASALRVARILKSRTKSAELSAYADYIEEILKRIENVH